MSDCISELNRIHYLIENEHDIVAIRIIIVGGDDTTEYIDKSFQGRR